VQEFLLTLPGQRSRC